MQGQSSRQPDGFAQAAIHLGEYRKMSPGPVEEWIFYDHPSGRNRIYVAMQRANTWFVITVGIATRTGACGKGMQDRRKFPYEEAGSCARSERAYAFVPKMHTRGTGVSMDAGVSASAAPLLPPHELFSIPEFAAALTAGRTLACLRRIQRSR